MDKKKFKPIFYQSQFYIRSLSYNSYERPIVCEHKDNPWMQFQRFQTRESKLDVVKQFDERFKHFSFKTRKHRITFAFQSGRRELFLERRELFLEQLEWIKENVECSWSVGASFREIQFSFDDLPTATLFRLRF